METYRLTTSEIAVAAFVATMLTAAAAEAVPRFAARTGNDCSKCHVNPTGGGPRTRYGRNVFEREYLPIEWGGEPMDAGADLEVGFGDGRYSAALGADVRAAYLRMMPRPFGPPPPEGLGLNSFYLMQADLYVTAELTDYVTLSLDQGLNRTEVFGMVHSRDRNVWLKAGQFVMPYGLRMPNHRLFVREQTGFNPAGDYRGLDTGLEAGASLGPFNLVAAVSNGKPPGGTLDFDGNKSKAVWAKTEFVHGGDGLKLRLGLNAARNFAGRQQVRIEDGEPSLLADSRVWTRQAGAYITAALGRFSYIGEVDVFDTTEFSTDEETFAQSRQSQTGYASYQELGFTPTQGVDLQALVEFSDPSVHYAGGTMTRIGAGFEIFPLPMLEWKLVARHTLAERPRRDGMNELFTYLHFFM